MPLWVYGQGQGGIPRAVKVYPVYADPLYIEGNMAPAWGGGPVITLVPAATILRPFVIVSVAVEWLAPDSYQLALLNGASATIAQLRWGTAGFIGGAQAPLVIPTSTVVQPAGELIRAQLSTMAGGAQVVYISVGYQEY